MKKFTLFKLLAFSAVLTAFAYTGCRAEEVENFAPESPAMENSAGKAEEKTFDIAPADDAVAEEAAPAEGAVAEDAAMADDAVIDAVPEMAADEEMNAPADIAPQENLDSEFPIEEITPSVGMLTAGEWKDHENWGFFSNLVNTGIITFPSFGIDPTQRISVTVTDSTGTPLPNATVTLNQDSEIIWTSVTDKNGQAYLFEMNGKTGSTVTASLGEISQSMEIQSASTDEQGNIQTDDRQCAISLDTAPVTYPKTQMMFIVDTTGSMGDEMLYLQSDFSAIAEETGTENTSYSVNFYKDSGDDYVTKCSGFTSDVQEIKEKLNQESAYGGGDEPEAVYNVLKETIFSPEWQEDSVKIAFLIYDAPPHAECDFESIISEASAKGIHLIPIVSSNGSRETELFGRALAICTNSSYVFLTDDSGIGNSHLEPIIGDYEVEPLHDIIVRIIQELKQ